MFEVYTDERWAGSHGIGRFALEVQGRLALNPARLPLRPTHPLDSLILSAWLVRNPSRLLFSPGYNAPLFGLDRYALVVHDLNHIDMPHNSGQLKRLYYSTVLKRACRSAAVLMTVSKFTAGRIADWAQLPLDKIHIVGNGVSKVFRPDATGPAAANREYLLIVGNRKGHKNELVSLRSFAAASIDQSIELVFTGNPSDDLVEEIKYLGLNGRVRFAGRLTEPQLAECYRGAIALLFASLYEGFGLPVIEAMACGTPVITSSTTSLPEVAGNAALLVEPTSIAEISSAIERVVSSKELRDSMRHRGFAQAQRFDWDNVASRVKIALASAL